MTRPAEDDRDLIGPAVPPRPWVRPARLALWVFVGGVVFGAVCLCVPSLISLGFTYERNYNEGWNVYNTLRLVHHEVIYDNDLWRVNNYPIGSFLIVAAVDSSVGDPLLSGRIVAAAAFLAIGVLAAVATRGFGGDRVDAVFGGACAAGFCYLMAPAWIAVDDPQSLAEAIMLGGLVSTYRASRTASVCCARRCSSPLPASSRQPRRDPAGDHPRSRRSARRGGWFFGSAAARDRGRHCSA